MNSILYSSATAARRITAACGVGVLLVGATACGSTSNDDTDTPTSSATSGPQTTQQGRQFPGANGTIAAVDGSTAQVQSQQNGQVAVTWTDSTTFTQEVAGTLSDVKVGDCVSAMPDQDSAGSSTDDTQVTAARVRIISTGGDCSAAVGGLGGGGQRPDVNGTPPSGAPSDFPTDGPGGGQLRRSFGAIGTVAAVSTTGFTLDSVRPGEDTATSSVAVTVGSSTTYTKNASASASDVKVGGCMTAQGAVDDTGAVTAKTVALSPAVDGECGGFARFRNGGPGSSSGSTGQES